MGLFGHTRKFNGKAYTRTSYYDTKAQAQSAARSGRRRGFLARIVRERVHSGELRWVLYSRRK